MSIAVDRSYCDLGDPDFSAWNPAPPDGDGWFLLSIGDTEDGPMATYVRRLQQPADQVQGVE